MDITATSDSLLMVVNTAAEETSVRAASEALPLPNEQKKLGNSSGFIFARNLIAPAKRASALLQLCGWCQAKVGFSPRPSYAHVFSFVRRPRARCLFPRVIF